MLLGGDINPTQTGPRFTAPKTHKQSHTHTVTCTRMFTPKHTHSHWCYWGFSALSESPLSNQRSDIRTEFKHMHTHPSLLYLAHSVLASPPSPSSVPQPCPSIPLSLTWKWTWREDTSVTVTSSHLQDLTPLVQSPPINTRSQNSTIHTHIQYIQYISTYSTYVYWFHLCWYNIANIVHTLHKITFHQSILQASKQSLLPQFIIAINQSIRL